MPKILSVDGVFEILLEIYMHESLARNETNCCSSFCLRRNIGKTCKVGPYSMTSVLLYYITKSILG